MKIKIPAKPGPRRPASSVNHKRLSTRQWWGGVVSDPRFWDVINHIKSRCPQTSGVKETPHAQSYSGGFRDAWFDYPEELVKIAMESSEEDIPRTASSGVDMVEDPDLINS